MDTLKEMYKKKYIYLFLLPAFAILLVFGYYPPLSALLHAFTDWNGETASFIGMANFVELFKDQTFIESIGHQLLILIVAIIFGNLFCILAAELIVNLRSKALADKFKFLFTLPMLVPIVVVVLTWKNMVLNADGGLVNTIIGLVGIPPSGWLGEASTALISLMLFNFPWISGMGFLIYLAGLQSIPISVIESAGLDGAKGFKRFIYIDLPLIVPQIKLLIILGVIGGFQSFQVPLLISFDGLGGPAYSLMVPGLWMYTNAFNYSRFGYASAMGVLMFIFIFIMTLINMKFIKTNNDIE